MPFNFFKKRISIFFETPRPAYLTKKGCFNLEEGGELFSFGVFKMTSWRETKNKMNEKNISSLLFQKHYNSIRVILAGHA
jgi:hypothetical protein